MADLVSLIVSTFERPDALDVVLRALSRQTDRNFEIVIADDGSGPETAQLIARRRTSVGVPLIHAWHDHRGFRAGEIRNRAIMASRGTYCVFLDGDCIPRPDFVARHRALAEPGWFVVGNRTLLSPELTAEVLTRGLEAEHWGLARLAVERARRRVNRVLPALGLPLGPLRYAASRSWIGARTCNLAAFRADLAAVDGFDAQFAGWGLEDSDLVIRLINAGIRRKDGRFATGVLHLWHPEAARTALTDNQRRLDETMRSARIQALRGMSHLARAP